MQNITPAVVNTAAGFFSIINPSVSMEEITDNSKVIDHHAIIPTINIQSCDIHSLPLGEREILLLITLRLICAIGESYRYGETTVTAKCSNSIFTAKGKTTLSDGFKAVEKQYFATKKELPQEDKSKVLPHIAQSEIFTAKAFVKEGKASPPKHFSDDTLLAAMENAKYFAPTQKASPSSPCCQRQFNLPNLMLSGRNN